MPNIYDSIIVIDVESTCWEGPIPKGEVSEIIEIGVAELDPRTGKIKANEAIMIKPTNSSVSKFCTDLTTLTQEDVDNGMSLADACALLENKYKSRKGRIWASYGDYDRKMFQRNCSAANVRYPFGDTHINVKMLSALMFGLKKEVGMPGSLELCGLTLEGVHHRGVDDSKNIANILYKLIKPGV